MEETPKKVKLSITLDSDLAQELAQIANARFAGNLSAAASQSIRNDLQMAHGPMSKLFQFSADISATLRSLRLPTKTVEHCVDWLVPSLALGIEAKLKFTPGRAESATVATMAYSAGQGHCSEIWIVVPDSMSGEDKQQWGRVASEFHLCPVKVVVASALAPALEARARARKKT